MVRGLEKRKRGFLKIARSYFIAVLAALLITYTFVTVEAKKWWVYRIRGRARQNHGTRGIGH